MHRLVLAGLLPALLIVFIEASPVAGTSIVTEEDFLSALDDDHPAVAERAQAVAAARARVLAARTFDNPVLGLEREDPSGAAEKTDWTLSWQLPGSDRRLRIEALDRDVVAVEAGLAQELLELRLAMREVYAEWALAAARQRRFAARAARLDELVGRESARAERGEASGLEVRRLALAAAALRTQAALAEAARASARARVAAWSPDLPDGAEPVLPDLQPVPPTDSDPPRLRAARAELEAATLERRAAARFVASPEVRVGWQREESGMSSVDGSLFGLAWSIPLFQRNRAPQALAEARVTAARARLETVRRQLTARRDAARDTLRLLVAALAEAEAAVVGNDRMLDGIEAAFRHGEAPLVELLETLRATAEAEMTVLDLHAEALAARRELERLTGAGPLTGTSVPTSAPSTSPEPPSPDPTSEESLR